MVNCPYTGAFCDIRNQRIEDIIGISCNQGDGSPTTVAPTLPPGGPAEGELRLAGGPSSCEGRLEVYVPFLGQWAQATYRDFGTEEVQVACRELGCGDGSRIGAFRYVYPQCRYTFIHFPGHVFMHMYSMFSSQTKVRSMKPEMYNYVITLILTIPCTV